MITPLLAIARNTFVESIRQPVVLALIMVCFVLQFITTWTAGFALSHTETGEVSGDSKLVLDIGLATIFVCGTLLAGFVATSAISREIENKTVLTVVSKPVGRPTMILGKYLGSALAILVAVIVMLIMLMLSIRHGVLTNASDTVDGPVLVFMLGAILLSMFIAAAGNLFYGWYFTQACVLLLLPLSIVAFVLTLLISKKWAWQPIGTDFKDQIAMACGALTIAILVLTAVAIAVSTRLGQVLTIVACAGVFLVGLLGNAFIGQHVFVNERIGQIKTAAPEPTAEPGWGQAGAKYTIEFQAPPKRPPKIGDSFYYSPSPNGWPMLVREFPAFAGDPSRGQDLLGINAAPALVVTEVTSDRFVVRKAGQDPLAYDRAPEKGDSVFFAPTRINAGAMAVWGMIPNMHHFWLLDAVSQNQRIPLRHLGVIAVYGALQIVAFLALGVALFQRREVG